MKLRIVAVLMVLAVVGAVAWGTLRLIRVSNPPVAQEVPTTRVKKGRVVISVAARGELQGGHSEMLSAPMTGNDSLAITYLREPGELVQPGDTVVQFDTTMQDYNLREAQADLAEAEQQVIQAETTADATNEETDYALQAAQSAVTLAALDVRRNPLLPAIQARQNDIALDQSRNKLHQAETDIGNKKSNANAATAIQLAALNKAKVQADTAQRVIDSMTLKAKTAGYVNIQANTFTNFIYTGMQLQPFQLGDTVRPGLAVAQIPDLKNWEVSAQIGELDRGHLSNGQPVTISVVAVPGKTFAGHVKTMGGTAGPPWDRKFECRITLDKPAPELRPGETSNMIITVETLNNVTWIPSQALYESDSRKYVYLKTAHGFMPHDVKLVRSSESQAVIGGLKEGDEVAMSNPEQQTRPAQNSGGAMKALQK